MAQEDFYEILGVEKGSSDEDIKKAYRRLAMKCHPDRNKGDKAAEDTFKKITRAYETLSDPVKRRSYDQFGGSSTGHDGNPFGGAGFSQAGDFGDAFNNIFSDIFGNQGGGGRGFGQDLRGSDLKYDLVLSFEDAIFGTNVKINIPTMVECDGCSATGANKGSKPVNCGTCNGHGQVRMQQGFFSIQQTCSTCGGAGKTISDPCKKCKGHGRVKSERELNVKIPAGIDTGDRIRVSGKGEAGLRGAPTGDLYVEARVKEHEIFKREGNNLYCEVPVSIFAAACGAEIDVPTFKGAVKLKIPAETQNGKVFRVTGKGVTSVNQTGVGDLFCKVLIEIPVDLSREQRALLMQIDELINKSKQKYTPKIAQYESRLKKFLDNLRF